VKVKNSELTVMSPCPSTLSLNSCSAYLSCNPATSTVSENNSVYNQKLPRHTQKLVNIVTANIDVITNKMPELVTRLKLSQIDIEALSEICPRNSRFQLTEDSICPTGYNILPWVKMLKTDLELNKYHFKRKARQEPVL